MVKYNQEEMIELQMIQQEAEHIEERIQVINQQIQELIEVKRSLNEINLKNTPVKNLFNIGKGIFIESETVSKQVFVNIGAGVIVKRDIMEAILIIDNQIKKLNQGKDYFFQKILEIQEEAEKILKDK